MKVCQHFFLSRHLMHLEKIMYESRIVCITCKNKYLKGKYYKNKVEGLPGVYIEIIVVFGANITPLRFAQNATEREKTLKIE